MSRRERRAVDLRSKAALNGGASTPAALCKAGFGHMRSARYPDAQACCQQALAADPAHADSLHLMGLLSLHAKRYDAAMEWLGRAIRQEPRPEYISSLGTALQQQGRLEEALKAFDKAVQIKPDDPERWIDMGNALIAMKRPAEALLTYQHALELDPRNGNAAYRCGMMFYESGALEQALTWFNRCAELRPNDVQTLHLRAATLRGLKRFEGCLADNLQVHRLDPAHPLHCNNVGDALLWLGRSDEALKWFDKALKLQPDNVDALCNKAVWFRQNHRLGESAEIYQRLMRLHPGNARFERDRAYVHLLMGNFEAGWPGREARWRVPGLPIIYPNFSQPAWLGNAGIAADASIAGDGDIAGKTVLLYADEGLGDSIQFARYVPMVAALGARVVLVVPDALYPLLKQMPGVAECRSYSSGLPSAFDRYCALGSLPLAFGTRLETIPPAACLPPPAEARVQAWEERLGLRERLRVGLVWSGNPKHGNDRDRSISLRSLAALFDLDVTFVSLQKDPRPDDKEFLRGRTDIVDLTADLADFAETAALISCLDMVITVDTSVAHLAATLGCSTWILLPHLPDWRWLLGREDSPWYPAARLFRQTATREYESVLDRVRDELQTLIDKFPHALPG